MLIAKEELKVQYNGKTIEMKKGQKLDVRDFDVANKDVKAVEKHIVLKNTNKFTVSEEKIDSAVSAEASAQIKDLTEQLAKANEALAEVRRVNVELTDKHSATAGEVEAAKQEVASIKKELTKLKKENDDLDDEVKRLREQVAMGKKGK